MKQFSLLVLCFLLSACDQAITKQFLEHKYTNAFSDFVEIDGNRVHFRDEGEGDVLVLIHGTASSLHTWDAWTQQLKDRFRIIRMDLPGFGLTGPDMHHRYEVQNDTEFLASFLEELNIDSAHFAGSSLGGRIAWQYALDRPAQVKSLILLNSLGYPQEKWPPAIELAQWPVLDRIMEHVSPRFMFEIGLKDVYFDQSLITDALTDRYFEMSRYPGNLAAFPRRVKARLDQDSNVISDIQAPTLILWGKEDRYFPVESAYRFNEDIQGSEMVVFDRVGHLPMEEIPVLSAQKAADFLARVGFTEAHYGGRI